MEVGSSERVLNARLRFEVRPPNSGRCQIVGEETEELEGYANTGSSGIVAKDRPIGLPMDLLKVWSRSPKQRIGRKPRGRKRNRESARDGVQRRRIWP
jgi:hypothetical protein